MQQEPSPEVKAILKAYCDKQRAELGPDWKRIKAEELAKQTAPTIAKLLKVLR